MSKIIKKEEEIQEALIRCYKNKYDADTKLLYGTLKDSHKQTLINLKGYVEEQMEFVEELLEILPRMTFSEDEKMWDTRNTIVLGKKNELVSDLVKINKMIEKYNGK